MSVEHGHEETHDNGHTHESPTAGSNVWLDNAANIVFSIAKKSLVTYGTEWLVAAGALSLSAGIKTSIATMNPIPAIAGAFPFVLGIGAAWLLGVNKSSAAEQSAFTATHILKGLKPLWQNLVPAPVSTIVDLSSVASTFIAVK